MGLAAICKYITVTYTSGQKHKDPGTLSWNLFKHNVLSSKKMLPPSHISTYPQNFVHITRCQKYSTNKFHRKPLPATWRHSLKKKLLYFRGETVAWLLEASSSKNSIAFLRRANCWTLLKDIWPNWSHILVTRYLQNCEMVHWPLSRMPTKIVHSKIVQRR